MRTVLLIEDDPGMRSMVSAVLESGGYAVRIGGAGQAALEDVRAGDYDLLLTDLVMGEADGFDVIRATRAARPDVPIVVISGAVDRLPAALGANLPKAVGADRVLAKPFRRAELLEVLAALLAKS